MKRSPLRPRSKKRQALMVQRRKLIAELMELRDHRCEARLNGCSHFAVDVHEKLRRSQGGAIVDTDYSNFMILCRPCHTWITDHPKEAFKLGFAKHAWDK